MIKRRRSVDEVHSEQSQWVGPSAFTYKAEVDFDGTWLAAQLYKRYEQVFLTSALEGPNQVRQDLNWLLPAFAEDVTRVLEKEVRDIQQEVRVMSKVVFGALLPLTAICLYLIQIMSVYKEAAYIEIVPDSSQNALSALETFMSVAVG